MTDNNSYVPLGGSGWELWPDVVLRSAGFPAAGVSALADKELAAAADAAQASGDPGPFQKIYQAAEERLRGATQRFAADPRLREAVAWQNRALLDTCLDKARAGEPPKARGRIQELTVASYVQRYHVKNDTIGFFGPVGWAAWTATATGLVVRPGPGLLSRRRTYFEEWAVDAVGDTLAADPALRRWLRPRLVTANLVEGRTVHFPNRHPVILTEPDAEILVLCDGHRTAGEIADEVFWAGYHEITGPDDVLTALERLRDDGLVRLGLDGPVESFPETTLRRRLAAIGDAPTQERALQVLDDLVAARDAVSAAAGDAEAVAAAIDTANHTFETAAGTGAVRRHGRIYAGRTILYEDTIRDVQVELGRPVLDALAGPLALMLDSAAWLVQATAAQYERLFLDLFERARARHGTDSLPVAAMLSLATPYMFRAFRHTPEPVRGPLAEMQQRWAKVLDLPQDTACNQFATADIAERVRAAFPASRTPWSTAIRHSPDVMIAARDVDAVNRGEVLFVLGELHLASNTIESRVFVAQHEDPDRLRGLERATHNGRRRYLVPPKAWSVVTSRTYPPSALLTPDDRYWSLYPDSGLVPDGPSVPAAAMRVHQVDDRLVVRSRVGAPETPLAEVIADQLSAAVVNSFRLLGAAPHTPRVTIDNTVVSRESWTFQADAIGWVRAKDESVRFRQARAWRAAGQLPERVFYRVPVEDKPLYLDFSSIVLVNMFAKAVRRTLEHETHSVSLSEMLPDLDQNWLVDATGAAYCTDFRLGAATRRDCGL